MKDYKRTIKLKFKFLSIFYDAFDFAFLIDQSKNPRENVAKKTPDKNIQILDVCIGTANTAIAVAKSTPSNKITGIDLSEDMIKVAGKKIKKLKLTNISLEQMDATKLDFKKNNFDIVLISFGLHELEHNLMLKVLKEMNRVLKKNCKIYIIDYEEENRLLKKFLLWLCLKIFEPKHMWKFLLYNWEDILKTAGFALEKKEKQLFSKIITGIKKG